MLKGLGAFLLIELVDLSLFNLDKSNRIRIEEEIVKGIVVDKEIEASAIKIGTGILGIDTIGSFMFLR